MSEWKTECGCKAKKKVQSFSKVHSCKTDACTAKWAYWVSSESQGEI